MRLFKYRITPLLLGIIAMVGAISWCLQPPTVQPATVLHAAPANRAEMHDSDSARPRTTEPSADSVTPMAAPGWADTVRPPHPSTVPHQDWVDLLAVEVSIQAAWCGADAPELTCSDEGCATRLPTSLLGRVLNRPALWIEKAAVAVGAPAMVDRCASASPTASLLASPDDPTCFIASNGWALDVSAQRHLCEAAR